MPDDDPVSLRDLQCAGHREFGLYEAYLRRMCYRISAARGHLCGVDAPLATAPARFRITCQGDHDRLHPLRYECALTV